MRPAAIPCVLALFALLTVQRPARAQAGTDTTTRSDTSVASFRSYGDSAIGDSATRQGQDTARAGSADTGSAQRNLPAQPASQAPPAPQAPPTLPTPPVDSALKAACQGAQEGTRALGLLLVTFSDSLTERQRLAIARSAGGRLAGAAATGGNYVQVPADPTITRMAADSLIRTPGVLQVTERSCPALVPSGR
jgi:hypothetical protein